MRQPLTGAVSEKPSQMSPAGRGGEGEGARGPEKGRDKEHSAEAYGDGAAECESPGRGPADRSPESAATGCPNEWVGCEESPGSQRLRGHHKRGRRKDRSRGGPRRAVS